MSIFSGEGEFVVTPHGNPIAVQPLRYKHIFKSARSFSRAAEGDPLTRYFRNNRKLRFIEQVGLRLRISTLNALWIRTKVALTIHGGTANIIATPPRNEPDNGEDDITKLINLHLRWLRLLFPKGEQEKRREDEYNALMDEAIAKTIGDRVEKMWYIDGLCTDPASQGQGYGGALLDAVTSLADIISQTVWLQSSNVANTGFYNLHGFRTIAEVEVGIDDPTWPQEPVVVSLMIREPRVYIDATDEKQSWSAEE